MRGWLPWVRRGASAVLLLAVGFTPAEASVAPPRPCPGRCTVAGTVRWVRPLTGSYLVEGDSGGTVPARGEPYAAIGAGVAVLGAGTTVQAFGARTGQPRWSVQLGGRQAASVPGAGAPRGTAAGSGQRPGVIAGAHIVSVRTWPGVVSVGLSQAPAGKTGPGQRLGTRTVRRSPGQQGGGEQGRGQQAGRQQTVVLDAATGRVIRAYRSAPFGGTVAADSRHTVVVQPGAVTSYRNSSGTAAWSVPTGPAPQSWRLDGGYLYMTVGAGGGPAGLAQRPAAELRRIDLRTGAERIVRARPGPFAGSLGAALDGVVLFSNSRGVTAYSGSDGRRLWSRGNQDLPQGADPLAGRFYLSEQGGLAAVDPRSGKVAGWLPGSDGLYTERDGIAFGMDEGPDGSAWGVNTVSHRVVWTVSNLPWPHYFVDLSGLGGSADPRSDAIILASCGQASPGITAQPCANPELVVINR